MAPAFTEYPAQVRRSVNFVMPAGLRAVFTARSDYSMCTEPLPDRVSGQSALDEDLAAGNSFGLVADQGAIQARRQACDANSSASGRTRTTKRRNIIHS